MLQREALWSIIEPVVSELGLQLFDIDLPSAQGGIMRITIANEDIHQAIGVEECAKVSKKLSALDRFEDILPPNVVLEVSSPGLNRRLRTEKHFYGAIGEHLRVKAYNAENKKETLIGRLCGFNGRELEFQPDTSPEVTVIPYSDVVEARVDYVFD